MQRLAHDKLRLVSFVITPAFFFGGLRGGHFTVHHGFDHGALGFGQLRCAERVWPGMTRQQTLPNRLLAQQFGVSQLAQRGRVRTLPGCMQGDAIDQGLRHGGLGCGRSTLAGTAATALGGGG
ncbi:hypothetical protein LP415_26505 [Polaromonas sp. P1(28)-8]|nr:hypothetical protein LP415_26505 [Polaromonas sp. P1(28)-8]